MTHTPRDRYRSACEDVGVPAPAISVLIVDDHVATRAGLKAILTSEPDIGVVGETGNPEAAVTMAGRRRPDVVIMDLQFDHSMAGFDATREILAADPSVAVVLFTAFGERQLLTHGLECGARGFVIKDATPDEVVRAVRTVAGGGAFVDPSLSGDLLRSPAAGQLAGLSDRERQILSMLADGVPNKEIAARLFLSPETVRTHVRNAMRKLDADTRTQAVALAIRERLIV
jgi:DNA-binding NarL/FixJ family response regulator